ncbi:UNVERIFIED_CONTAM: hypothetical protein Sradi_7186600 [Sesamum radiatum]|uniref:Uncharacterized protein n=1 Tax=Sesamum radiatum TaxID=300843 RepID=A0AAW2IU48_SESRA
MVVSKNVLGTVMRSRFLCLCYSPIVITEENYGLSNARYHTQLLDVVFHPTASFAASEVAMYSASMVESAVVSCLKLFQATTPPLSLNTKPDWDLASSSSDWKLASLYPSSINSPPP